MSYLGNTLLTGNFTELTDFSGSFDSSTTQFALTTSLGSLAVTPIVEAALLISINGVIQEPTTDYTVSGTNITFTSAPDSGDTFFGVVMGRQLDIGTPSDQTVTSAKLSGNITLPGSFKKALHTFTGTDAVTEDEHAGRTLLLGEVGGNANVVLTMPDATGTGNIYHFIVSVAMGGSTTYKIQAPDANNTFTGQILYLDEDGTAVTSFPTVSASDTITLNSGTQGGLVGDTLTLIDIAADKYAVSGNMRVSAGANPATPFSAAVS